MTDRRLQTIPDASRETGIPHQRIRGWIDRRAIWSTKVSGRVFVDRLSLDRFIQDNQGADR